MKISWQESARSIGASEEYIKEKCQKLGQEYRAPLPPPPTPNQE